MSLNIIFVHGTGVREPSYSKTFNEICERLRKRREDLLFHKCYWGGECGSTLNAGGKSIPIPDSKRSIDGDLSDEEFTLQLWNLLYQDPLFELQILSLSSEEINYVPGRTPGVDLDNRVKSLAPSPELQKMLNQAGIGEFFDKARTIIVNEEDYNVAIAEKVQEPTGEFRLAIAHALVAQSIILARIQYGEMAISLNAALRDKIVDSLVMELGGGERSPSLKNRLMMGIAKRVGTWYFKPKRNNISDNFSGNTGDILMYQARGEKIRKFIRDKIEPLTGPIVLIAHSLGGIACADLLLEKDAPKVDLFVTVGSQVAFLYELNALVGMEYDPNTKLPPNFPRWLNIFDKNDFLSYVCASVFCDSRVEDLEVKSNEPFPDSHGEYWGNDKVWDAIVERMIKND